MFSKIKYLIFFFITLESICRSVGVSLYPFGLDARDEALSRENDDISSPELRLLVPIVFYGQQYTSLYINQNGLVSFVTEIPQFVNTQFPLDYVAIAPLYSDVDTRILGSIFFRETKEDEVLERGRIFLAEHFLSAANFQPTGLVIVTWDGVGSYDRKSDKIFAKGTPAEKEELILNRSNRNANTFQLVIASDGKESFAIFLYEKIEWIQGTGKNPSFADAIAQAGLLSGSGPYFTLKGSGKDQVSKLHKRSNSGSDGIWAFRIGRVTETVEEPNQLVGTEISEGSSTCADGGEATCHSRAVCVDYSPGFCCKCIQGFYGNGRTCLEDAIPHRAVGKVNGVMNGIAIEDKDFYSYIMPAEGKAYTSIGKIPERLGYDLQSMSVIGTIVGWLFSTKVKGAVNGFQLTGGVFNYTAEVAFLQTGHKVTINQAYMGFNAFSIMEVETRIHGTTAIVPVGMKIEVNDYEMLMTRVAPGVIRSKSNHNYRIEGTSMDNPFTIEQTVTFEECPSAAAAQPELNTIKMKVGRNYIIYDPLLEIVRYAFTSTVTPPDGEDPCKSNKDKCGEFSSCVANGDSFRCICNLGFEEVSSEGNSSVTPQCKDIDECRIGTSDCDMTAICTNSVGSYSCRCRDTYIGDGLSCAKILTCSDIQCGTNGQCFEDKVGEPECRCVAGFHGDGLWCIPQTGGEEEEITEEPTYCRNCDRNADCVLSPSTNSYVCSCREGYYGDGTRCAPETTSARDPEGADCRDLEICDQNADCVLRRQSSAHHCVCRSPFVGNGYICKDTREDQPPSPNPEPECEFGDRCWCPTGFQFDDIRHQCVPENSEITKTCDVDPSVCDINAVCVDQHQTHRCICKTGFDGDGKRCLPQDLCRSHAECGEYGVCTYNRTELRHRCECKDKFTKEGDDCKPGPDVGCDILNNCDTNGRCVWESEFSKFICECKPGYLGDGFSCEEDMTGCNVLNNCARNAECSYDTVARGFRCQCRQGFQGDGHRCRSSMPCYQDRTVCDINAECVPNQDTREWRCHCKQGFTGDGFDCQESGARESQFLLVTKGMSLIKVPVNGEKSQPITVEPFQTAIAVDIDCPNERVYWSDVAGRTIKSSFFNGTSKITFLTQNIGSPEGLSLDWAAQNLYWTDSLKDTIEVANLQTRKRKTLIFTGLVNPRGIAVYPQRGRLYWCDWNREYPKIEFSGLDGMGRQILVGEGLALPNSLLIDTLTDQLCFADAGTHKIECVGIDGRNRRTFVSNVKYPFGLALGVDTFYWTDWETQSIESASRRTGSLGQSLEVALGRTEILYGIVLVPKNCPQAYSPCSHSSCQDDYICLPNMRGGRSCRCTDFTSSTCKDLL